MNSDFSERQIHPEKWLQELGPAPGKETNGYQQPFNLPPISETSNVDGDFLAQSSPFLSSKGFDFDPNETLGDDTDMECSSIRVDSFSRMEDQYIEQEQAGPQRASFQMVLEMLNDTTAPSEVHQQQQQQPQQQPEQQPQQQPQQHQLHQQLHQLQQQQQLKQIMLLRQREIHQQQKMQQSQQSLQQIVQMLQQPLQQGQLDHARMLQDQYTDPQMQSSGTVSQMQNSTTVSPVQNYATVPRVQNSATVPVSHVLQNSAVSGSNVPNGMVMLTTTALPQSHIRATSSPDSTTQQPTTKRGRGRPPKRKPQETKPVAVIPPSSCSRTQSHDILPLPSGYDIRVRVHYRTILAADLEMNEPQGCLIYYNRPPPGDLTGVRPVQLQLLTPNADERVTEKQLKFTNQVLSVIEKGVRIQVDAKGNVYATRHCRSKVFWWNTMNVSGESEEMKRDATVKIFNNEDFENQMREFAGMDSIKCMKPGVVLTFAQRWSKFDSHLNAHLVYAIITPLRAVQLLSYLMEARGQSLKSLDLSLNSGNLAMSDELAPCKS